MRALGLAGVSRRKRPHTTLRDREARPAPDLVDRDFTAPGPDRLWVADITYVPTWAGFLYLAVVLDAWSRRVVGWSMATQLRTELVLEALNMALTQRRPTDVIHHSDQGCQLALNRSSQHCSFELIVGARRGPRRESASRGSCAGGCSTRARRRRYLRGGAGAGRCPSGSTGAGGRWCSRSSRAATGCADHRSRSRARCRRGAARVEPSRSPGPRQRSSSTQTGDELALERAAALDEQSLIDRLVRYPHGRILGEVEPQPIRDLLGAPRRCPPSVRSTTVASTDEPHLRAGNSLPVDPGDRAREPVLHVRTKPIRRCQLRRLGTAGLQIGLPLRNRRPIVELAASRGRIAAQLTGDRRRETAERAGDRAYSQTLPSEQRDVFALGERQVPPRQWGELDRRHATPLAEPANTDRAGHATRDRRFLARESLGDLHPEPPLHIAPHRRSARRPHRRPPCQRHHPPSGSSHSTPPSRDVATTG